MPSLSRRREFDGRADRFESEVRSSEMRSEQFQNQRKFMCSKCHVMFEERSRTCPRCESRTMGELKPIPEKYMDEAQRGAIARAKAHRGAKLPGQGL